MKRLRQWLASKAARALAKHGNELRHRNIIAKAQQMRRECGLADDPRLRA